MVESLVADRREFPTFVSDGANQELLESICKQPVISPRLKERVSQRIAREHSDKSMETAGEILDEVAKFLTTCAAFPKEKCVPSRRVDVGWHAFLMFTRGYQSFCEQHFGKFIHHEPKDDPTLPGPTPADTVRLMKSLGMIPNPKYWPADAIAGSSACGGVCCCD